MFAVILLKDTDDCVETPCVCVDLNTGKPAIYGKRKRANEMMAEFNATFRGASLYSDGPVYAVAEVLEGSVFEGRTKLRIKKGWEGNER